MSETTTIILSILGINVALFVALGGLMIWFMNKIDTDVNKIGSGMDLLGKRLDGHATRIEQLYKMFVDLLAKK